MGNVEKQDKHNGRVSAVRARDTESTEHIGKGGGGFSFVVLKVVRYLDRNLRAKINVSVCVFPLCISVLPSFVFFQFRARSE